MATNPRHLTPARKRGRLPVARRRPPREVHGSRKNSLTVSEKGLVREVQRLVRSQVPKRMRKRAEHVTIRAIEGRSTPLFFGKPRVVPVVRKIKGMGREDGFEGVKIGDRVFHIPRWLEHQIMAERVPKFRTMKHDAAQKERELFQGKDAFGVTGQVSRIGDMTMVGRVLREIGLDEAPQLVNVALGNMRLVGLRAVPRGELSAYPKTLQELYRYMGGGLFPLSYLSRKGYPPPVEEMVRIAHEYWEGKMQIKTWAGQVKYDIRYAVRIQKNKRIIEARQKELAQKGGKVPGGAVSTSD